MPVASSAQPCLSRGTAYESGWAGALADIQPILGISKGIIGILFVNYFTIIQVDSLPSPPRLFGQRGSWHSRNKVRLFEGVISHERANECAARLGIGTMHHKREDVV